MKLRVLALACGVAALGPQTAGRLAACPGPVSSSELLAVSSSSPAVRPPAASPPPRVLSPAPGCTPLVAAPGVVMLGVSGTGGASGASSVAWS